MSALRLASLVSLAMVLLAYPAVAVAPDQNLYAQARFRVQTAGGACPVITEVAVELYEPMECKNQNSCVMVGVSSTDCQGNAVLDALDFVAPSRLKIDLTRSKDRNGRDVVDFRSIRLSAKAKTNDLLSGRKVSLAADVLWTFPLPAANTQVVDGILFARESGFAAGFARIDKKLLVLSPDNAVPDTAFVDFADQSP